MLILLSVFLSLPSHFFGKIVTLACVCPSIVPVRLGSDGFAVSQNSYKGNIIMVHFPSLFYSELN